mgnify:FL=1
MILRKKDFWKGFVAALALVVVVVFVWQQLMLLPVALPFGMSDATKMHVIEKYLDTYYVEDYDKEQCKELMYVGLAAGVGDPYTYYLSEEDLNEQIEKNNGHFVGIGVTIYQEDDGYVCVDSVTEGGPAQEAGIQAEDKIIRIDGEEISQWSMEEISNRIKGKEGTTVAVSVFRPSTGEALEFTVTRRDIQVQSVTYHMLQDGIGYIAISNFRANTYEQFETAMKDLQNQGMVSLILDLRNNTGGLVNTAHQIGDMLLPEGVMVYTLDKEGNREDTLCDADYIDLPLMVLVNGNSASASEILAGAIQDTGRGTLIGTTTFGKGLVQRLFTLPDGSGLNVTIQKYYTPAGRSIHGVGIEPDVVVSLPDGYADTIEIPTEQDTQLQKAIELLQK